MKKYLVNLSPEERDTLTKTITSGCGPARMFTRARILLKADQGDQGPNCSDEKISDALDVTVQTIERILKQFVEEGFAAVLSRRQYRQKDSRKKIDGNVEAHLIALSSSEPPQGYVRWTLQFISRQNCGAWLC